MESSYLLIQSNPIISDPRELQTILLFSLKSLFGECEPHGCQVSVLETRGSFAILLCPNRDIDYVRAALTMCSPPAYLHPTIYHFDCVQIETDRNMLTV